MMTSQQRTGKPLASIIVNCHHCSSTPRHTGRECT